jgi:hypothetical protein
MFAHFTILVTRSMIMISIMQFADNPQASGLKKAAHSTRLND